MIGSSLRGEVGLDVIQALHARGIPVAADMQGFVRVLQGQILVYTPWPEMALHLAEVDILKSDAVEAEALTGEKDIYQASRIYASMGPKEIVLTHKDGVLFYANGEFSEVGFYPHPVERAQRARRYLPGRLCRHAPEQAALRGRHLGSGGHQPEDGEAGSLRPLHRRRGGADPGEV